MNEEEAIYKLCDIVEAELKGIKAQVENIYMLLLEDSRRKRGF